MSRQFNPRSSSHGRKLDQVLDRIVEKINELRNEPLPPSSAPEVFNDSQARVSPFLLYGISGGAIAPAVAGVAPIEPLFQAKYGAAPGASFEVCMIGPTLVLLDTPGQSVTPGMWGWLSATVPGRVSVSMPAAGVRYRVCQLHTK